MSASAIDNQHLYTGRERDLETGFQLNRNRYYHQQLGRWLTRDPIGYVGSKWSLYQYAYSRPISTLDPIGTDCRTTLVDQVCNVSCTCHDGTTRRRAVPVDRLPPKDQERWCRTLAEVFEQPMFDPCDEPPDDPPNDPPNDPPMPAPGYYPKPDYIYPTYDEFGIAGAAKGCGFIFRFGRWLWGCVQPEAPPEPASQPCPPLRKAG